MTNNERLAEDYAIERIQFLNDCGFKIILFDGTFWVYNVVEFGFKTGSMEFGHNSFTGIPIDPVFRNLVFNNIMMHREMEIKRFNEFIDKQKKVRIQFSTKEFITFEGL